MITLEKLEELRLRDAIFDLQFGDVVSTYKFEGGELFYRDKKTGKFALSFNDISYFTSSDLLLERGLKPVMKLEYEVNNPAYKCFRILEDGKPSKEISKIDYCSRKNIGVLILEHIQTGDSYIPDTVLSFNHADHVDVLITALMHLKTELKMSTTLDAYKFIKEFSID